MSHNTETVAPNPTSTADEKSGKESQPPRLSWEPLEVVLVKTTDGGQFFVHKTMLEDSSRFVQEYSIWESAHAQHPADGHIEKFEFQVDLNGEQFKFYVDILYRSFFVPDFKFRLGTLEKLTKVVDLYVSAKKLSSHRISGVVEEALKQISSIISPMGWQRWHSSQPRESVKSWVVAIQTTYDTCKNAGMSDPCLDGLVEACANMPSLVFADIFTELHGDFATLVTRKFCLDAGAAWPEAEGAS